MGSTVSPARHVAFKAFTLVMERGSNPDAAIDQCASQLPQSLSRLDRNLAKELVYGTLRWYSKMYWILQNTSKRPLKETTPEVRSALLIGTYQIFYMQKVPDRAAVNESAEFMRSVGQASAVSFVNGILRQIARRAAYFPKPDKVEKPVEYLALQFAHPEWLVRRWFKRFNFEKVEEMLQENNQPPPWSVRVNATKTELSKITDLQTLLVKNEKTQSERRPLRSALRLAQAPAMDEGSLFQNGYYTIQDESSQLIGYLVAPKPGERLLDCATGPGGKLGHLAELTGGQADLVGIEKRADQVTKAETALTRLGLRERVTLITADTLEYTPEEKFDRVLLDAPCSGLGVLRRHPEGKWQKNETLIHRMVKTQRELISHALTKLVKTGGELIYSVCSFEPEESIDHLAWIKEQFGDRIDIESPVSRLPDYYKKYVTRDNVFMVYAGNSDQADGFAAFIIKLM